MVIAMMIAATSQPNAKDVQKQGDGLHAITSSRPTMSRWIYILTPAPAIAVTARGI
jgi:hypothetical protein